MTPADTAHLTPRTWARVNRLVVRKAIAELTHEDLLHPDYLGDGRYLLRSDDGRTEYRYAARVLSLDHWLVDAEGLTCHREGAEVTPDAAWFFVELRGTLELSDDVLPVYLEEVASTLSSLAYKLNVERPTVSELIRADFQDIEAAMTEGHPCFVANSGRLGFGIDEYHAHAPEAAAPVRLVWLAAHRSRCTFTAGAGLDEESLMRAELGEERLRQFTAALEQEGLSAGDYRFVPVHPWQWRNKLAVTFAADVARRYLVYLGESDDEYRAQQSIRTFFDVSSPHRHYVKTALSVLNMGFMRGLSAAYMAGTPAINDWLADLVANDEVLGRAGFTVLRERASVGYRQEHYEAATQKGSPYRKMLAALWRESPVPGLAAGERLATMASLLHVDDRGRSFAAALVEGSGLAPKVWLRRYLDAYLVPLLHSFYAYGLAYMPHGENIILVLDERGAPVRVIVKDVAEEIVVMDKTLPLPEQVERIRADVAEDERLLSIFTDVFDSFLRFLAGILVSAEVLEEETFWRTVADCAADYQCSTPALADEFARYDLFADRFARSCLNRLQLRDNTEMVDLQDPSSALQLVGTLTNPIAQYHPSLAPRPPAK